jgi:hypothetical protein
MPKWNTKHGTKMGGRLKGYANDHVDRRPSSAHLVLSLFPVFWAPGRIRESN